MKYLSIFTFAIFLFTSCNKEFIPNDSPSKATFIKIPCSENTYVAIEVDSLNNKYIYTKHNNEKSGLAIFANEKNQITSKRIYFEDKVMMEKIFYRSSNQIDSIVLFGGEYKDDSLIDYSSLSYNKESSPFLSFHFPIFTKSSGCVRKIASTNFDKVNYVYSDTLPHLTENWREIYKLKNFSHNKPTIINTYNIPKGFNMYSEVFCFSVNDDTDKNFEFIKCFNIFTPIIRLDCDNNPIAEKLLLNRYNNFVF